MKRISRDVISKLNFKLLNEQVDTSSQIFFYNFMPISVVLEKRGQL